MAKWSAETQNALLTAILGRFSEPSSTSLNPACVTESTLYRLLGELSPSVLRSGGSKAAILDWLLQVGLLSRVPVEYQDGESARRTRFYAFDTRKGVSSSPTPFEMLQAYDPDGVICYFSAIAFYALSTQTVVHHHVATLKDAAQVDASHVARTEASAARGPLRRAERNPLGTSLFAYGGVPYYQTSRLRRLIPGVKLRYIGPTAVIRITTLEQTLLDTLHRPLNCGGPSVVFEAWEQALPSLSEMRLIEHLDAMNHPQTIQRVGCILANLNYEPGPKLAAVLDNCVRKLDPADESQYRQLLPGVKYENLRMPWLCYGP